VGLLVSWLVFIVGAILQFGLTTEWDYVNEIGVVLIIIGALGFVLSLIRWESWGRFTGFRHQQIVVRRGSDSRNGQQ
jgi:hypothetical protein